MACPPAGVQPKSCRRKTRPCSPMDDLGGQPVLRDHDREPDVGALLRSRAGQPIDDIRVTNPVERTALAASPHLREKKYDLKAHASHNSARINSAAVLPGTRPTNKLRTPRSSRWRRKCCWTQCRR